MHWQRVFGGISGAISVGAGAYGAHGLSDKTDTQRKVFETGARYQLIHSVVLAATPAICGPSTLAARAAGSFFALGTLGFSGSCYAAVLADDRKYGQLAPVGGFSLIFGWLSLAFLMR